MNGALVAKNEWQDFQNEIESRKQQIAGLLPRNLNPDRFINSAVAAIKQNPDLLLCDRRSLFAAITKSAQDGLLPDGREGVITSYNTNIAKRGEPDRWIKMAQWNPMVYGLRKRARETDQIIIDAQVVYENDEFDQDMGDQPHIRHKPPKLGQPRGEIVGAYAIFRREDGVILHREVMVTKEIEDVRGQSKAKSSLMWTTFKTEGYRKTVIRRGIKTVPVSEILDRVVRRDDENFDFGHPRQHDEEKSISSPSVSMIPHAPPAPSISTISTIPGPISEAIEEKLDRDAIREANGENSEKYDSLADWVNDMIAEAKTAKTREALDDLNDQVCRETDDRPDLHTKWIDASSAELRRINGK